MRNEGQPKQWDGAEARFIGDFLVREDLTRCFPELKGGYFDYEFKRVLAQMRKRVKAEGGAE